MIFSQNIDNNHKKLEYISLQLCQFYFFWNFYTNMFFLDKKLKKIKKNRPLGRFIHRVAMSVYICIYMSPPQAIFFEASHWPSDHMISSRPPPSSPSPPRFFLIICFWYCCYYPHKLRDSVVSGMCMPTPVCLHIIEGTARYVDLF